MLHTAQVASGLNVLGKREALNRLQAEIRLAAPSGARLVFGEGDIHARLGVVGEAPGREEEEAGRPFVGYAGHLLDRLLREVLIPREELWITNLVKWRPVNERGGRSARAPRADEVKSSEAWLIRELEIIHPCLILCLGNHSAQALIDRRFQVADDHGRWRDGPLGAKAMDTFHPAYVGRFGGVEGQIFELTLADFRAVKSRYEVLEPPEDVEPATPESPAPASTPPNVGADVPVRPGAGAL